MKIALPVANGQLCMHFGHCEKFALYDVNEEQNSIEVKNFVDAPPHEPGLLPVWLAGKGVNCIIAGGMGSRAQQLFSENKIQVITGATPDEPEKVVEAFLHKKLVTGDNACDH